MFPRLPLTRYLLQTEPQVSAYTPGILSCGVATDLWVAWDNAEKFIRAGTGPNPYVNEVVSWNASSLPDPPEMNRMGISGSLEAETALWTMPRRKKHFDNYYYYNKHLYISTFSKEAQSTLQRVMASMVMPVIGQGS